MFAADAAAQSDDLRGAVPGGARIVGAAETVEAALAHGADFIGLNFYRPSPRYVSLAEAGALARLARGRGGVAL
mgnify:CR=1 FL=1